MKRFAVFFIFLFFLAGPASVSDIAHAHCEVPCGIYDDEARLAGIAEDITTIEKGIRQINELSAQAPANMNQLVRWINNKDKHADRIKKTVAEYFLSQRVKKPAVSEGEALSDYHRKLELLHDLTVWSMKAKQTTDPEVITKLRNSLEEFRALILTGHTHTQ